MKTLTTLETKILKIIINESFTEYAAWFSCVVKKSNLKQASVKGVIGSLTAKGVVITEDDEDNPGQVLICACYSDNGYSEIISFGCDVFATVDDAYNAVIHGK